VNETEIRNRLTVNPSGVVPITYGSNDYGLRVFDYNNTVGNQTAIKVDTITGVGQVEAFRCSAVTSTGTGDAIGLVATGINASGTATGYGISCENIIGTVKGVGANFRDINGLEALGVSIVNVNASTSRAVGINIETVKSTGNDAFGLFIQGVTSVLGGTLGYGIFQNGLISGGNVLQSKLECGASETTSQPLPSLNVIGTVQSSVQLTGAISSYTISNNAGNTVISDDAANTVINLPAIPYFGAEYTIWKTHGGTVAITPAPSQPINGSPGPFTFLGAAYKTATIVWSGSEWLAHLN
jgi:hypothetical protein